MYQVDEIERPYLELVERDMVWSGKENQPVYQLYKGKVKLSVYMNCGLLTIHVIQAKNLFMVGNKLCNSYLKLCLVPDEKKRTQCKTKIIRGTNNPKYDQRFSFEILPEDQDKRLILSVWHRRKTESELLGCMSFGIKKLVKSKKEIGGWYFLLSEEIGRQKHLKFTPGICKVQTKAYQHIPKVHSDVLWMESLTVCLRRGERGFGFTVVGSCPVRVGRVEQSSEAWSSGLRTGDYIVQINSQNVSRSTAESVVRLVRHSSNQIIVDVQRPRRVPTLTSSPRKFGVRKDRNGQSPEQDDPIERQLSVDNVSDGADCKKSSGESRQISRQVIRGVSMREANEKDVQGRRDGLRRSNSQRSPSKRNSQDVQGRQKSQRHSLHEQQLVSQGVHNDQDPQGWQKAHSHSQNNHHNHPQHQQTTSQHGIQNSNIPQGYGVIYELHGFPSNKEQVPMHKKHQEYKPVPSQFPVPPNESPSQEMGMSRKIQGNYTENHKPTNNGPSNKEQPRVTWNHAELENDQTTNQTKPGGILKNNGSNEADHTNQTKPGGILRNGSSGPSNNKTKTEQGFKVYYDFLGFQEEQCKENAIDVSAPQRHSQGTTMALPQLSQAFQDLSASDQKRQQAIQKLIACEEIFTNSMHAGVQRYSRPLRHQNMTQLQHSTMFQNVEKIVAISQYLVNQLHSHQVSYPGEQFKTQGYIDAVGSIYHNKISVISESYETYCKGLPDAVQLLRQLSANQEFAKFIQKQQIESIDGPDLLSFLHYPPEHLRQLLILLQSILSLTPLEHHDQAQLQKTVEGLRSCCNRIYSGSLPAPSLQSSNQPATSTPNSSSNSSRSNLITNQQVLDIQNRLCFAQNVPVFQLYDPKRHLIHTGQLLKVEGRKWIQLYALLFSDLLLLTVPEPEGSLIVVEQPILFKAVTDIDYNRKNNAEFVFKLLEEDQGEPDSLCMRALSASEKQEWKTLLDQQLEVFRKGVHLEDSSSSSRHYQDGGSDQEGLSREASPVFNRHALQTRRHTDTSPSLVQHQRQKTYGDYLTVPGGHHHALRRHTDTGLEEEDIPEARLAVQFQDKCRLRGLSPSPSRHSKHAYDSAIELESDGSKSRCSSEHLDVPPSSPISSGQSTPTEVEQGAAEGQDTKEREVRKNRFKKILRPIRRSHSAGCTKDVPAYALFLQKAMPASSGNLPRRSSQPSQMDKMEQEVDIPQVVVEEKAKKKSKNLVKDVKRRLRQVRRTHTDSVVTVEPARTLQPTPSQAGKWSQSFEALLADKCGLGLFQEFLRTEFSEENIEFWIACEEFKNTKLSKLADKAQKVYSDFVAVQAPKEINLDSKTRLATLHTIRHPDRHAFDAAQKRIQGLMEKDSYPRFLQSQMYKQLIS